MALGEKVINLLLVVAIVVEVRRQIFLSSIVITYKVLLHLLYYNFNYNEFVFQNIIYYLESN